MRQQDQIKRRPILAGQRYLTITQVAEYLGIGVSTALELKGHFAKHNVFPTRVPGTKKDRYDRFDLDRMMEEVKDYYNPVEVKRG